MNVLFTSAGRRVELLRSFRAAYQRLSLAGRVVVTDIDPLAPAIQVADAHYMVPRYTSPDYVPALAEICRREQINVVFPLIDPDIPILAHHRAALEATGTQLAVVSAEAAAVARDKWMTRALFESVDLPVPRSWLPEHLEGATIEYPVFIKPRAGSAAENAFKVLSAKELSFFLQYVPNPIIQEFLPGPEITNDVVCDLSGRVLSVVSRRRLEVRNGEVSKGVTFYDPQIAAACVKVAGALPAVGPITVQCMLKEGKPYFTEINARLGGGIPLAVAAGVDVPGLLLASAAGLPVEIPALGGYRIGLYLTRFDDAFVLSEEQRAAIQGHHL